MNNRNTIGTLIKMTEETWHGIPRDKIPWQPTINYEKCVTCGKCVEFCTLGTYEFEESNEKKIPVVKNPNNCVVLCSGCDSICPAGAIKHPAKKQARELIRMLRGTYRFQK
jgi:NAD-dependent dihydropyrimidine dehydrogenase PreA subunit